MADQDTVVLQARIERLTDLVRFARHYLYNENLISDQEFAALVQDSDNGQRVARLETYDEMLAAMLRQAELITQLMEQLQAANDRAERGNRSRGRDGK